MQTSRVRSWTWLAGTDRPEPDTPRIKARRLGACVRTTALALLAASAALLPAPGLKAADINVAAGVVIIANDGQCSLREAIVNANNAAQTHANCIAGDVDNNNIVLPAGSVFTLPNAAVSDAFGNTGLPYVTRQLRISGNGATIRGGASCSINGTQTAGEVRLIRVQGVALTIQLLTLSQGCADGTGNARLGGAIYLDQSTLQLEASSVRDNRAFGGAGIYSVNNAGTVINLSTLAGNTATEGGALNVDGQTDVFNSTLSGNSTFSLGAGAYLRPGATLHFDFVSVDGSASAQPNEIHASGATMKIKNSFFRNARCSADGGAPPSTWLASGNNLDSSVHCANLFGANIVPGATLNLGPLADNGGSTQTRALLAGSHAIDGAGDCTAQAGLLITPPNVAIPFDQRLEARPQGTGCDIGAFESALTLPPQTIFVDAVSGVGVVPIQADGLCSLREAIENANSGGVHADCETGGGIDTIVLPVAAVFTLADAHVSDSFGSTGLPYAVTPFIIAGQGATIQRSTATACNVNQTGVAGELRLLAITSAGASVTLEDLTLANGCADGPGDDAAFTGGAVLNLGEVILRRSTIRDSQASLGGGVANLGATRIESSTLSGNSATGGGAVFVAGSMTVSNSTLSGNSASSEGGAAFVLGGHLDLEQSSLSTNSAPSGGGIKIGLQGTIHARNTVFQNSTCAYLVPAPPPPNVFVASGNNLENGNSCALHFLSNFTANGTPNLAALASNGGTTRTHALNAGSQALNAASNCTAIGGGAIANDQRGLARPQAGVCDIGAFEAHTAPGAGVVINVDAVSGAGVIPVLADGLCSLREGLENANANSASFVHPDCEPGHVSGLDQVILPPDAVFTLTDAAVTAPLGRTGLPPVSTLITIQGNGATIQSGNTCTFNGTQSAGEFRLLLVQSGSLGTQNLTLANGCADGGVGARDGGAIHVAAGAGATLLNTTLRGNRARSGGAIYSESNVLIQTSTLTANTGTFGGGVYATGTATLSNSTVSGNNATSLGGAGYVLGGTLDVEQSTLVDNTSAQLAGIYASMATVNLKNSVLANTRCVENTDVAPSTWTASGNSLDDGSTCATRFGAKVAANSVLLLAPLADQGGVTETHALLPGSPAIDAAVACTRLNGSTITVDQRGVARPQNLVCDIGAFESRGFTVALVSGTGQSTTVGMPFANPLVVGVSSNFSEPVNGGRVSFTAPVSGASLATPTSTATIVGGQASLAATANAVVGNYEVSAGTRGALVGAQFNLGNLAVSPNIFANGFEGN